MHGWIVGRGPSLEHLTADDIGPGLVITLNEAIAAVDRLDLPNVVVSLQNDRCDVSTTALVVRNGKQQASLLTWDTTVVGIDYWDLVVRAAIAIAKTCCSSVTLVSCDSLTSGAMGTWTDAGVMHSGFVDEAYADAVPRVIADLADINHDFLTPMP